MNPYNLYYGHGPNVPFSIEYHRPIVHRVRPHNLGQDIRDPSLPTVNGNSAVHSSSADVEKQDDKQTVTSPTSHHSIRNSRKFYQRKKKKQPGREKILAEINCLKKQLVVKYRPIRPKLTMTSTPQSVTIETEFHSTSKVVNQTFVDDSNIPNLSGEQSESTDTAMEQSGDDDEVTRNQQNAQQLIVETPIPMTAVENGGSGMTSTTHSLTIETEFCSASKVVNQTFVDDSNIPNLSGEHSESTDTVMEQSADDDEVSRNQQNAQQPIVESPIPMMAVENSGSGMTSTTHSLTIETEFCSASKVVNQTSIDATNIPNLSREHSESTVTTMDQDANEEGSSNQQDNAQQPIVETPIPVMALENNRSEDVSSLTMAIIRTDCMGTKLSPEDGIQIQMDIHTIIESQSDNDTSPQFDECNIEEGALIVRCANEETVQWLKSAFENNDEFFADIHVIKASELPKIRIAYKTRDALTSDPVVFLKRLQRQNPKLCVQHWTVAESPSIELSLQTKHVFQRWIFKIDQASADAIKSANMTAYTGLFKGTFEFLPDVESPKETVIIQEADTSCV